VTIGSSDIPGQRAAFRQGRNSHVTIYAGRKVRQYRKQPDVPAFRGNNRHSGKDGDAGQQWDKKASECGSRGGSGTETGKSCAEFAEDQGIKSRIEGIKWARVRSHVRVSKGVKGSFHRVKSYHYVAWQSMKRRARRGRRMLLIPFLDGL
jgi:hypothetical protein